jgi:hypothetical protein
MRIDGARLACQFGVGHGGAGGVAAQQRNRQIPDRSIR